MRLQNVSDAELEKEFNRRAAQKERNRKYYTGELEPPTDGDQHREDTINNPFAGPHYYGRDY